MKDEYLIYIKYSAPWVNTLSKFLWQRLRLRVVLDCTITNYSLIAFSWLSSLASQFVKDWPKLFPWPSPQKGGYIWTIVDIDPSRIVPNSQRDCLGSTNTLYRVWSQWMDGLTLPNWTLLLPNCCGFEPRKFFYDPQHAHVLHVMASARTEIRIYLRNNQNHHNLTQVEAN